MDNLPSSNLNFSITLLGNLLSETPPITYNLLSKKQPIPLSLWLGCSLKIDICEDYHFN